MAFIWDKVHQKSLDYESLRHVSTTIAIDQQLVVLSDELKAEKYKLLIEKWNDIGPDWPCENIPSDSIDLFKKMDNEFDSKLSCLAALKSCLFWNYLAFKFSKLDEGLDDLDEITRLHYEMNKANYDLFNEIFEQLKKKGSKINKQKRKRAEDVTAKCVRKSPRLQATYRRTSARLAAKKKN